MDSDFLIIGSGIAGLSFALRASKLGSVVVVTKKEKVDSATNLAQGGIAAVLSVDDSVAAHTQDTLDSGAGICNPDVVSMVVEQGAERVRDLLDMGVEFIRDEQSGKLELGKEGGHSYRRVAHSYDLTGREIERALLEAVKQNPNILVLENYAAIDLLMSDVPGAHGEKRCVGAYVLKKSGAVEAYRSKVTTICTGGCGKVYLYTSNPDISTGDGVAMAFRAGAKVTNMEFIQFHPTCLYHPLAKNFLISEAVRGEGGVLIDNRGERFMQKYDSRGELATRDAVARAIDGEMKERGLDCVFLDITHKSDVFLERRFPTIYEKCRAFGLNISRDPIPVVPAAHYMCGGVMVDEFGKSSVPGLLVLGESACTGLHGGNRLASNSLLEAVVYAQRAYTYCEKYQADLHSWSHPPVDQWSAGKAIDLDEEILINHNWDIIRRTMWNYVGIVRNTKRLKLAQERVGDVLREIEQHYLDYYVTANMIELRNISLVAVMIIEAALQRKESRGLHFTVDHPGVDPKQKLWNVFVRDKNKKDWGLKLIEKFKIK